MQFTITITDPAKLAGITAARLAHNAALPDVRKPILDKEGKPTGEQVIVSPKPGTLATDAEYVQHVMDKAAESYAVATQSPESRLAAKQAELDAANVRVAQLETQVAGSTR